MLFKTFLTSLLLDFINLATNASETVQTFVGIKNSLRNIVK